MKKICAGVFSTAVATAVLVTACKKDNSGSSHNNTPPGEQTVSVYLNDDPAPDLSSVLIDVRTVEVKVDTGKTDHDDAYYDDDHEEDSAGADHHGDQFGAWDTLSINPGVYDLLKLKNGTDTLIAKGLAKKGKISRLRITLGSDNKVWTDSSHSYPLTICNTSPYVYVRVKSDAVEAVTNGENRIRIDFDAARSIEGKDGQFCLRPRLKAYADPNTGKLEGNVQPGEAHAKILVFNNTDTSFAFPEENGSFEIRGLLPDTYTVLYKATAPYMDSTVSNIQLNAGAETKLPDLSLHK
ncbi:MAG TPA: DUF4382 domain-containing protein [Puia sp.]